MTTATETKTFTIKPEHVRDLVRNTYLQDWAATITYGLPTRESDKYNREHVTIKASGFWECECYEYCECHARFHPQAGWGYYTDWEAVNECTDKDYEDCEFGEDGCTCCEMHTDLEVTVGRFSDEYRMGFWSHQQWCEQDDVDLWTMDPTLSLETNACGGLLAPKWLQDSALTLFLGVFEDDETSGLNGAVCEQWDHGYIGWGGDRLAELLPHLARLDSLSEMYWTFVLVDGMEPRDALKMVTLLTA